MTSLELSPQTPRVAAFGVPPRAIPVRLNTAFPWALLLLVLSQVGRIPLLPTGDREAPLLINELVLGVLFVIGAIGAVVKRSFVLDRVVVTAIVFAAVGAFSTLMTAARMGLTMTEIVISLAYLARWVFYLGVYVYIINHVKAADAPGTWQTMETMLLLFAAFGIFQSAFLPNFAFILYPNARVFLDFDPQGHRLVSTILEPNVAGMILVVGLLVQLLLLSTGARVVWWKMAVLAVALLCTVSRSALIGLFFGGIVIVLVRGLTKTMLRITFVVSAVILALLPKIIEIAKLYQRFDFGEGSSAMARYEAWVRATGFFLDHPVLGIGFNTFAAMVNRTTMAEALGVGRASSEGGLLFVATMTGVVGLTIFIWMLTLIILRCRYIWRHPDADPTARGLAMATTAVIVATCMASIFINALFATFTMELLWTLSGLTFALATPLARDHAG